MSSNVGDFVIGTDCIGTGLACQTLPGTFAINTGVKPKVGTPVIGKPAVGTPQQS